MNSNAWTLASNKGTLNIEPKKPSLDLLNHSSSRCEHNFFRTLKGLKHVHLLVIELAHIFMALKDQTTSFEHCSSHHYIKSTDKFRPISTSLGKFEHVSLTVLLTEKEGESLECHWSNLLAFLHSVLLFCCCWGRRTPTSGHCWYLWKDPSCTLVLFSDELNHDIQH